MMEDKIGLICIWGFGSDKFDNSVCKKEPETVFVNVGG